MRRPAAALALALMLAGLAAGPAHAGGSFSGEGGFAITLGPGEGRVLATSQARTIVGGEVVVTFAGDPATCAAAGRCGTSGTLAWRPGSPGLLGLIDVGADGRASVRPFFTSFTREGARVLAQVRRPRAGGGTATCTDTRSSAGDLAARVVRGDLVLGFDPRATGLFDTRCGGPVPADLAAILPQRRVPIATVRRGTTFDLRAEGAFTAGGLTGTVRSTVTVRAGRQVRADEADVDGMASDPSDAIRATRWRVARVTGSVGARIRPVGPEAACAGLDACGLDATLTLAPRPGESEIDVYTPRGGGTFPDGGGRLFGVGGWTETGTLSASVGLTGAVAPCTDQAPVPGGLLELGDAPDGSIRVAYEPFGTRSRCPGPGLESDDRTGIAFGSLPAGAFDRARRVTVRLTRGTDRVRGGFRITTSPDLTLELVRAG